MVERKHQVFISHAQQDTASARKLAARLETLGQSVWLDDYVEPGGDWESSIAKSLKESDIVVLLVSRDSLTSQWTSYEAGLALEHARKTPGFKILPVLLEPVDPGDLPPPLRSLQLIDASNGGERATEAINRALGPTKLEG